MKSIFKCFLTVFFIIGTVLTSFCACANTETPGNEKLTYYLYNESDVITEIIKRYNKYCKSHYDASYQIEIVSFESEDQLLTKFSTELMAGKGPDLISLSMPLSFEKLIESGAFADVNEINAQADPNDKIDFNEYNAVVMDSGVFDGKRFIVPLFYGPDVVVTTKEILQEYDIPSDFKLTYDSLEKDFSTYLKKDNKVPLLVDNEGESFFYNFIDSYANLKEKTMDFMSDQFSNNLDIMEQIAFFSKEKEGLSYELINGDCVLATPRSLFGSSLNIMLRLYAYLRSQNLTPLLHVGLRINEDDIPAFVQCGVAVNVNSNKKEKALAFIKYALSQENQEYWCGALENKGSDFLGINTLSTPVNLDAYQSALTSAAEIKYGDEDEPVGLDNQFMRDYLHIIQNINFCSLYNYYDIKNTYYNAKVIGSIVEQYLDGNMTKEKFIRDITSATKLYYYE